MSAQEREQLLKKLQEMEISIEELKKQAAAIKKCVKDAKPQAGTREQDPPVIDPGG